MTLKPSADDYRRLCNCSSDALRIHFHPMDELYTVDVLRDFHTLDYFGPFSSYAFAKCFALGLRSMKPLLTIYDADEVSSLDENKNYSVDYLISYNLSHAPAKVL